LQTREADSRSVERLFGSPAFVDAGKPTGEQMSKDFDEVLKRRDKEASSTQYPAA